MPKIKIVPIKLPFLPTLADYVWEKFKSDSPDLSDILVIFPSERNKTYFRRYLLNSSGKNGMIPPTMLTIEQLITLLFQRLGGEEGRVLDRIERKIILKEVVSSLKLKFWQDLAFIRFISIGDRLLTFFDELHREDVTLDRIEILKESLHFPERYVENELTILRKIFTEYRKVLHSLGYTDTEYECELIKSGFNPEILEDYSYILIAGLLATTEIEKKIIGEILSNLPSELVLHSGSVIGTDDLVSPFYNHNRLIHCLGVPLDSIEIIGHNHEVTPTIHIRELKSQVQETLYIRDLLVRLTAKYEPHRIAVILTDRSLVSPITTALKSAGSPFNLSMGLPLSQSLLYSFLSLLNDTVETNFHYKEFFALIRHPLLKNASDGRLRPIIYKIEREMLKNNWAFFRFDDFEDEEYSPIIELLKRFSNKIKESSTFSLYLGGIEELISAILFINPEFMESNILGTKEFFDHLQKMKRLIIKESFLPTGMEKIEFILGLLREESYSVHGDPFSGVQLIGVLEARNLDFDCLVLPSMNEGIFPQRSEKDLFLPAQLRKEVGLPYDKERENLYYYYFTELISYKKEVFISWVEREDRDVCSRFVSLLSDKKIERSPMDFETEKRSMRCQIQKDDALLKELEEMEYSPSLLKDYRSCGYRFYLKYILGLAERQGIVEEAGIVEWGDIIHTALQKFYSEDFPSHFTDIKSAERILGLRVEEALVQKIGGLKASSRFDLERYKRYIKGFLEEEIRRFEEGYEIHSIEERLEYELPVSGKKVRLKGRIDRIDRLHRRYYIIDYKTGQLLDKKLYQVGKNFTEFQLPLYALMFSDEDYDKIGGLLYYYISKVKIGTEDIMDEGSLLRFRNEILIPTICEIINPDVPFVRTDDERSCRICAYNQFCGR